MSQKAATVGKESHKSKGAGAKIKSSLRPAQRTAAVTEAELRRQQTISPEDVLRLEKATEGKWSSTVSTPVRSYSVNSARL